MAKEFLDEREFELINIIGQKLGSNQRDLSRHLDLSLGQTNMLVRRLVSKGLIRISQLNKRKVQYLLTPKGISEKLRQSMKYTRHTINSIGLIKDLVKGILVRLYEQGHKKFYVYSEPDLTLLIETALKEAGLADSAMVVLKEVPRQELDGILLVGKEKADLKGHHRNNCVDLVEEVAKKNHIGAGTNGEKH